MAASPFVREGGLYLVNTNATEPDGSDLFVKPEKLERPNTDAAVRIPLPSTCYTSEIVDCEPNLTACLAQNPTSMSYVCACYASHAQCYIAAGCVEALPRRHVEACFYVSHCGKSLCDGNGASRASLAGGVVAMVVTAAALLAAVAALP